MKYIVEVTLKLVIEASSESAAIAVATDELCELNDTMADHFVSEWSNPKVTDTEA